MDINKRLKRAIRHGATDEVELILTSTTPRNLLDLNEALMKAVMYCRPQCAKMLLEAYANPNYESDYGDAPLHRTCEKRQGFDMSALLIAFGANVNVRNARGVSPLHIVADGKNVECAHNLIEAKGILNIRDAWGGTPIWNAVRQNDIDMTDLLLEAGAQLDCHLWMGAKVRIFFNNRKAIKKVLVHIWCILHFRWKVCKDVTRLIERSVWETRKEKIWENVKF